MFVLVGCWMENGNAVFMNWQRKDITWSFQEALLDLITHLHKMLYPICSSFRPNKSWFMGTNGHHKQQQQQQRVTKLSHLTYQLGTYKLDAKQQRSDSTIYKTKQNKTKPKPYLSSASSLLTCWFQTFSAATSSAKKARGTLVSLNSSVNSASASAIFNVP